MSTSRLRVEAPDLVAQLERTDPAVLRDLAYFACSSASPHALAQEVVAAALSCWHQGNDAAQSCSEVAALAAQWDNRYLDLVASGADESEWVPYFRSARAGSAVVYALRGGFVDAIYEAVHAVKGVGDLVESLKARMLHQ